MTLFDGTSRQKFSNIHQMRHLYITANRMAAIGIVVVLDNFIASAELHTESK